MLIEYAVNRINAFLSELSKVKGSDFPYLNSEAALDAIKGIFEKRLSVLKAVSVITDKNIVNTACCDSRDILFRYLPLLGFILRSTNVRNAFEVYRPLLRLSQDLLGKDTNLIISSEWDYSPYTYHSISELPNVILIGLPAAESDNPLLIPLAGHELGHSVWSKNNLYSKYNSTLIDAIIKSIEANWADFIKIFPEFQSSDRSNLRADLFALPIWKTIFNMSIKQTEESFCDFIGLNLFGEAYLNAFTYLLSPGELGNRSLYYPSMSRRIKDLVAAAKIYSIPLSADYASFFADSVIRLDPRQQLMGETADNCAINLVSDLISEAKSIIAAHNLPEGSEIKIDSVMKCFDLVIPAQGTGNLSNILNAGWRAFNNRKLWDDNEQIKDKYLVLKELILKTIEVLEIEQITEGA